MVKPSLIFFWETSFSIVKHQSNFRSVLWVHSLMNLYRLPKNLIIIIILLIFTCPVCHLASDPLWLCIRRTHTHKTHGRHHLHLVWVETNLFNTCHCHSFFHPSVFALSSQIIVDLASAENDSLHLLRALSCRAALWYHSLKVSAWRFKQRGFAPVTGFGRLRFLRQYVPGSILSKLDLASGWRSSDLGVNIISWWEKRKLSHLWHS